MDYSKEEYYKMQQKLANEAYGAADYGKKMPFYMTYPVQNLYMTELEYEKEMERMRDLYPSEVRRLQEYVEEECDRLEYDGSLMFDEYPDRLMLRRICDRIYQKAIGDSLEAQAERRPNPMGSGSRPPMPPGPGPRPPMPQESGPRPLMPPGPGPRPPMPQESGPRPPMPPGPIPRPPMPQESGPRPPMPQESGPRPSMPQESGPRPPMPPGPGPRPPMPQESGPRPPMPPGPNPRPPFPPGPGPRPPFPPGPGPRPPMPPAQLRPELIPSRPISPRLPQNDLLRSLIEVLLFNEMYRRRCRYNRCRRWW